MHFAANNSFILNKRPLDIRSIAKITGNGRAAENGEPDHEGHIGNDMDDSTFIHR